MNHHKDYFEYAKDMLSQGAQEFMLFVETQIDWDQLPAYDLGILMMHYLDLCEKECDHDVDCRQIGKPNVYGSPYCENLPEVLHIFLTHGLDPNHYGSGSEWSDVAMMDRLFYDINHPIGVDALIMCLAQGGDLSICDPTCPNLFDDWDFDVVFDLEQIDDMRGEDHWIHCWLVAIGYGARLSDGRVPVTMANNHRVQQLKDYSKFAWSVEITKAVKDGWILHIKDKGTGEEVAFL